MYKSDVQDVLLIHILGTRYFVVPHFVQYNIQYTGTYSISIVAEKAKAGLRHAVVCHVTGRTKERTSPFLWCCFLLFASFSPLCFR